MFSCLILKYFIYILTFFISLCSERQMKCNRAGWRWSRGAVTRGTDSVYLFGFPNATGPRLNAETIFRNFGYVLIARWLRIWDQQTLLSILVSNEYHVRKNLNVSAIDYIIYYIFMCAQKFGILCCSDFHLLFDQAKIIMSLLAIQNPKTIIKRMSLCSEFSFLN